MHELGVVFHVIKSVNRIAEENGVSRVSAVTIELGEVSSVIPDYLLDCWKWAVSKETVMKDAELRIEQIKARIAAKCTTRSNTAKYARIAAATEHILNRATSLF